MNIQDLAEQINDVVNALRAAEGHAETLLVNELKRLHSEVNRKMAHSDEDEFETLFCLREQAAWQARTGGDTEWQAEQRREAMMLGEWDYDTQTPNW